jgi:hypothetical protein
MERNKEVRALNNELDNILATKPNAAIMAYARLQNAWEHVATSKALEHTSNIVWSKRDKEPTLLVFVDDSTWAAELTMQAHFLSLMMEQELGKPVAAMRFLISRNAAYKKEFKKHVSEPASYLDQTPSLALSAGEQEDLQQAVAGIEDTELRNRLYNAAKDDLEWKKGINAQNQP